MDYNATYNTYRATDTGRWVCLPLRRDEGGTIYVACPLCGAEDSDKAWVLHHIETNKHDRDPYP